MIGGEVGGRHGCITIDINLQLVIAEIVNVVTDENFHRSNFPF